MVKFEFTCNKCKQKVVTIEVTAVGYGTSCEAFARCRNCDTVEEIEPPELLNVPYVTFVEYRED